MLSILTRLTVMFFLFYQSTTSQLKQIQNNHRPSLLSNSELTYLSNLSNTKYTNQVLDNILIPRVVGTENHEKVFNYIKNELKKLNWNVEVDEFEEVTPKFGKLKFKNIIASLNKDADRYLVLACHYDSKYFEQGEFVGATDSAVPCAMLLNLAKVMKNEFDTLKSGTGLSLKLVFFDGEEAFVNWGPEDSIYGAKHLANIYDNSLGAISNGELVSELQKIDILVLLDLIGHKETKFYSNFENTQEWFLRLAQAEDRLADLGLLKGTRNQRIFEKRAFLGFIEDDHIPFLRKDVPILHLISHPFPKVWHTLNDNRDIIDGTTVENVNKILRVFVTEYLNMLVKN